MLPLTNSLAKTVEELHLDASLSTKLLAQFTRPIKNSVLLL